jgi:hypothetical protein
MASVIVMLAWTVSPASVLGRIQNVVVVLMINLTSLSAARRDVVVATATRAWTVIPESVLDSTRIAGDVRRHTVDPMMLLTINSLIEKVQMSVLHSDIVSE